MHFWHLLLWDACFLTRFHILYFENLWLMMFSYWTQDEIFLKMCRINHVRLPYCFMSDTLPFQGLDAEGGVGVDTGGLGPEWAALLPLPAVPQRPDQRRAKTDLAAHGVQHWGAKGTETNCILVKWAGRTKRGNIFYLIQFWENYLYLWQDRQCCLSSGEDTCAAASLLVSLCLFITSLWSYFIKWQLVEHLWTQLGWG